MGLILSGVRHGPTGISSAWDTFFQDWVKPVVHFGTPVLIVFAVLLTLTRVLTGRFVTKDSPGIRSAKTVDKLPVSAMYWFGVICLLYSAIEVTVIFPLARDLILSKTPKLVIAPPPAPLTADFSIGMLAAAVVVVFVLFWVVGRPLQRKVYAPGLPGRRRRELRLEPYARTRVTIPVTAVMAVVAGVLIAGLIGLWSWWRLNWLDNRITPGIYAPLLAALGIVIVGRARGIGMGLSIQGHDKNGGDDAGLGASVRARLYTLASHGPAGIQVTQQTDVSTLPQDALNLIPEGTLAKLATLLISLFTPSIPWRVDVTEQSDGSIVVSILRNGVAADAAVIRASTLWLPDKSSSNAGTASTADDTSQAAGGSSGGSGPGPAPDWTVELRTAAAAFILLTLSKRYYHLRAGLSGAHNWRSVAMQVIATDPAGRLSMDDERALLANAVAEDDGNMAARLAFLNTCYRNTADQDENRLFADRLAKLLHIVPNEEGMWPLRLRLRFNLVAAKLNEAAWYERPESRQRSQSGEVPALRHVLHEAAKQAGHLVVFWQNLENQKAFPDLWQDMDAAVTIAAEGVKVEWARRFSDPLEVPWKEGGVTDRHKQPKVTLLARYEQVCTLVGCAAISVGEQQKQLYTQALNVLEMVTAVRGFRVVARTDPSLAELHDIDKIENAMNSPVLPGDEPQAVEVVAPFATKEALAAEYAGPQKSESDIVDRFKRLTGDRCPADFLALSPFTAHRAALEERGIHSAAELCDKAANMDLKGVTTLVSELGITVDVADRWLKVAKLYTWLRDVRPTSDQANDTKRDEIATALVFLLMEAKLDSCEALLWELQREPGDEHRQFRARLIDCARPWAVAVPGGKVMGGWQRELEFPPAANGEPTGPTEPAPGQPTAVTVGN